MCKQNLDKGRNLKKKKENESNCLKFEEKKSNRGRQLTKSCI